MTDLVKMREALHKLWANAKRYEERRLRGLARLRKFSLITRLVKYSRFNKIRTTIKAWEERRSVAVMMALGMSRAARRVERARKKR